MPIGKHWSQLLILLALALAVWPRANSHRICHQLRSVGSCARR